MKQAVFQTIRAYYQQFNNNERNIANYILANPEIAREATIKLMSELVGTSTASISRFVKKIGFISYRDFNIAMSASTLLETGDFFGEISDLDDTQNIMNKVFSGGANALTETVQHLKASDIDQVVEWLLRAKQIGFFGIGGSSIVAFNAYHKFLRTPLNVISHVDYDIQLMQAVKMGFEDVGIVISHSGRNKDTLLVAEKLRENGSKIVAITSFLESPLAQISDLVLNSVAEEVNFRSESMSSLLAQISIIDTLFTIVGTKKTAGTQRILNKIRPSIEETRI
ncbi:MAG: MurR/RpiR family transcriptional regulator [Lactobacillaceae bacterium]|jgi:DNA-binding MurR/RpiR family transcriptional regulator|nr:MurR/RpiR family transcriptional regulator [Lactobacillaceae bacterium]